MLKLKRAPHSAQLSHEPQLEQAVRNAPGSRRDFDQNFLPDFLRMADWLGPIGSHRFSEPRSGDCHLHIATTLGAEALLLIGTSGYRSWSAVGEASLVPWSRLVWRRAMVLATGHICANHVVQDRATGARWTPLQGAYNTAISGAAYEFRVSNRRLDPNACEQAIAHQLYPQPCALEPMQQLAWIDSFAEHPNADNPIHHSLRRAARKCAGALRDVPYWWGQLLEGCWELELAGADGPDPGPAPAQADSPPSMERPAMDPAARFRAISVHLIEQWPGWTASGQYPVGPGRAIVRDQSRWLLRIPEGIAALCRLMPVAWAVQGKEVLKILIEGGLLQIGADQRPSLVQSTVAGGACVPLTADALHLLELQQFA